MNQRCVVAGGAGGGGWEGGTETMISSETQNQNFQGNSWFRVDQGLNWSINWREGYCSITGRNLLSPPRVKTYSTMSTWQPSYDHQGQQLQHKIITADGSTEMQKTTCISDNINETHTQARKPNSLRESCWLSWPLSKLPFLFLPGRLPVYWLPVGIQ